MDIKISPFSGFFRWAPASWLRVSGEDAATFLQGQFTQGIRTLSPTGAYGLWLNQKGKVVADGFVLPAAVPGAFWVGSYFSLAAVIQARLEAYVIADDVTVTDETGGWRGITVAGADEQWAASAARWRAWGAIELAPRRGAGEWSEWVFPAALTGAVEADGRGRVALSSEDMERARIAAKIPAVPRDVGPGELPNEGGLETVAISYTKGCYLGQEVMARLKSMGQVRRQLRRVRGEGAPAAVPATLWQGGRAVGELRSVVATEAGFMGLALCTLLHLRAGEPVGVGAPDGPRATVDPMS